MNTSSTKTNGLTGHKTEKDLKPLIDCDILRYRCGFAADSQVKKEFKSQNPGASDEELAAHMAELDYEAFAMANVKTVMQSVVDRFNPEYRAYVQGKDNFRDKIATIKPYKGNRNEAHKPKYYKEIKDYLLHHWNAIEVHGQESDDAIGIEQFDNPDKYTVIVSTDKDMDGIPGWHYNWVQGRLYYQTLKDANLFFYKQMLEGDTVDNIQGIYGIGPKTSAKLFDSLGYDPDKVKEEVIRIYKDTYKDNWDKVLWETANLLYIRRKPGEECPLI